MINNYEWVYKANTARKEFKFDNDNYLDIEKLIETLEDYTLIYCTMSENISGLCIKDENNKIIAVNSSLSKGRQRFTIAHELCHLLFHEDGCYVCLKDFTNKVNDYEIEANYFASYFLAPYDSFKGIYEKYMNLTKDKLETLIVLENYFAISHHCALIRLKQEGYISSEEYDSFLTISPARKAYELGFSNEIYKPTNINKTIGKYVKLANELYNKEKISTGKYEELLLDAFREDLVFGDFKEDSID